MNKQLTSPFDSLDGDQCALMRLLAGGGTEASIAKAMDISEKDVRRRILGLYFALDVEGEDAAQMRENLIRLSKKFAGVSVLPDLSIPPVIPAPAAPEPQVETKPAPKKSKVRAQKRRPFKVKRPLPVPEPVALPSSLEPMREEVPKPTSTSMTLAQQIMALPPADRRRVVIASLPSGSRGQSRRTGFYDLPILPHRITSALTLLPFGVPRLHLRRAVRSLRRSSAL